MTLDSILAALNCAAGLAVTFALLPRHGLFVALGASAAVMLALAAAERVIGRALRRTADQHTLER